MKHAMPEIVPGVPAAAWALSEAGRAACGPLAARLVTYDPARVVTSVEPKAAETGRLTAETLGLPVSIAPGLHEHDQGDSPFMEAAAWRTIVKEFFARPDARNLGQERAVDAGKRFVGAVRAVLDTYPTGTTIIVAHGRVISLFVARANAIGPFALWGRLGLPSVVVLSVPELGLLEVIGRADRGARDTSAPGRDVEQFFGVEDNFREDGRGEALAPLGVGDAPVAIRLGIGVAFDPLRAEVEEPGFGDARRGVERQLDGAVELQARIGDLDDEDHIRRIHWFPLVVSNAQDREVWLRFATFPWDPDRALDLNVVQIAICLLYTSPSPRDS